MNTTRQMRRHQERLARKGKGPRLPAAAPTRDQKRADLKIERLVACALIDADGETHHGRRSHYALREMLGRANAHMADPTDTLGFWTSYNRFVSRREGAIIADAAGQCPLMQRELLSSDIDW